MEITAKLHKNVACKRNQNKYVPCALIKCEHHHHHCSAQPPLISRRQSSILIAGALSFIQSPSFAYQPPDPSSSPTTSIPASASVCQIWDSTLPIPTKQAILSNINRPLGNGSGFIYDLEGHIITNWHVLQNVLGNKQLGLKLAPNALVARVFLPSSTDSEKQIKYDALLVGQDRRRDIVVLKLKTTNDTSIDSLLPAPLPLSTSPPSVGQDVLAIGNPLGFQNVITTGKIIQIGRPFASLSGGVISHGLQHTSSLNPGSSGGPLLNGDGTVVLGVNTAIQSKSGTFEGVSLAIPAKTVAKVAEELIKFGKPQRALLGIKPATEQVAAALKVGGEGQGGGILVQNCIAGGPADVAGILPTRRSLGGIVRGDVIVEVDGVRVENVPQLAGKIDDKSVGDTVVLKVIRDGTNSSSISGREVEVKCVLALDGTDGDADTDELIL